MLRLVTASGPGREAAITACLDSVFPPAMPALCDEAIVGWDTSGGRDIPPPAMPGLPVTFVLLPYRQQTAFAAETAQARGWVLWLRDDEVVLNDDDPARSAAIRAATGAAGPVRSSAEVREALESLAPAESYCLPVLDGGHVLGEGRLLSRRFPGWPAWHRPSVRGLDGVWAGKPLVPWIVVARRRMRCDPRAPVRLNIGAGNRWFSGWPRVDHDPVDAPDGRLDVTRAPLPYADGSVAAIYCSHMLDHLNLRDGSAFLRECRRVIAPGAPIRVVVCDLDAFVTRYQRGDFSDLEYLQPAEFRAFRSAGLRFGVIACGALSDRAWYSGHRQLYTADALCEVLDHVGFVEVRACGQEEFAPEFWDTDDVFPDHSATVAARAPCRP